MKVLTIFKKIHKTVIEVYQTLKLSSLKAKTGRPLAMKIVDVLTLGLYKQQQAIKTKRALYEDFKPNCSYKTFVVSLNRFSWIVAYIIMLMMKENRTNSHPIKHVDSSDLPVCTYRKAHKHRVMREYAEWGRKSLKDHFYGLKLHITTDLNGLLCNFVFTAANTDDRTPFMDLNKDMEGIFVADAGYISKKLSQEFNTDRRILFAKPRKNMKKLITEFQYYLYNTRVHVETFFQLLKGSRGLVTGFPRSVAGYFAHYFYCIGAQIFAF